MSDTLTPLMPILLVDDEKTWLNRLAFTLEYSAGYNNILRCRDSRQVLDIMGETPVSVVLLDLTMPYVSGETLLESLQEKYPDVPVIILSGLNQITTAVSCIKSGAYDYFVKTEENDRLFQGIARALEVRRLQEENRQLTSRLVDGQLHNPEVFSEFVTRDPRLHNIFQYLESIARSSEPVLITGESGTGKELAARAIHRLRRPDGPFVALNVAGLDDAVFSDTLFGHRKGGFTGADRDRPGMIEKASGGILFLDEIGDLTHASQVKLLRFLQEGEFFPLGSDSPSRVEAQVVCATNHDLIRRQAEGAFRKDLYFRLCSHRVHIPPLRERFSDLPLLLDHFLAEAATQLKVKVPAYPRELPLLLSTYSFPGNVRELRAMVFDALSAHRGGVLSLACFRAAIDRGRSPASTAEKNNASTDADNPFGPLDELPTLTEAADLLVEEAMRRADGNQSIAAGFLGISRQALNKRLKKARD